jgi:hypothetical protein
LSAFFLALVAAALVTLGGREAVRVARLSTALGRGTLLLVAVWLACAIGSVLAAQLGAVLAGELVPETKAMLVAFALSATAAMVLALEPPAAPAEPTRSFGALLLALGASQFTAGAGPLVFALAGSTGTPWAAAAGATLGSGAVLAAAWSLAARWEARLPTARLRHAVGTMLLAAAGATGLAAFGFL